MLCFSFGLGISIYLMNAGEYANKHEKNIAVNMANLWERKIGSDKTHSPRAVIDSVKKEEEQRKVIVLMKAGSSLAGEELQKKDSSLKEGAAGKCMPYPFAVTHHVAVSVECYCR